MLRRRGRKRWRKGLLNRNRQQHHDDNNDEDDEDPDGSWDDGEVDGGERGGGTANERTEQDTQQKQSRGDDDDVFYLFPHTALRKSHPWYQWWRMAMVAMAIVWRLFSITA